MTERIQSLVNLTNGKAEWYSTHAAIVTAERKFHLEWDGNQSKHVKASEGRIVLATTGSVGRQVGDRVYALSAAECAAIGRKPGPANN